MIILDPNTEKPSEEGLPGQGVQDALLPFLGQEANIEVRRQYGY